MSDVATIARNNVSCAVIPQKMNEEVNTIEIHVGQKALFDIKINYGSNRVKFNCTVHPKTNLI